MFILSVIPLALLAVGTFGAAVPKCHMETLSACSEPLQEFRKEIDTKFPTNEEEVTRLCSRLDEVNSCIEKFKKQCMTPMQLEIMKFVSEGGYAVVKEFCTAGSDSRLDYLDHAECINSAYDSKEFKDLGSYVEASLEDLSAKKNNEKLPTACCAYQWIDKHMKKLGEEKCGEEAVTAFMRVSTMAVSSLPNIFCQGFDPEGEQCQKVLPPPGTKPTGEIRDSHIAKTFSALYLED